MTILEGEAMGLFRLAARKSALKLEIAGMRRSRGRTAYAICKEVYNLKGSKESVYKQMCELVEKAKGSNDGILKWVTMLVVAFGIGVLSTLLFPGYWSILVSFPLCFTLGIFWNQIWNAFTNSGDKY